MPVARVGQRAVHDVGVPGDPADVGRAPVDLLGMVVEDELVGHGGVQQITAGGVHDTLGFARGARGVEDEQRILGVHLFTRAVGGDIAGGQLFFVPGVAALGPGDLGTGVLDHDARFDIGALRHGGVGRGLERGRAAAAETGIGSDHERCAGVQHPVAQGLGGEAAEDHAVDGADAGAGQHGHRQLRDHRQIDDDPIALLDALLLEDVRELGDFFPQLPIGDRTGRLRRVTLEVVGHLVGVWPIEMTIQAVVGHIQLAALEPADLGFAEVVVLHVVPFLEPVQPFLCLLPPEGIGVVKRAPVHLFVLFHARDPGGLPELGRYVEDLLVERFVRHHHPPLLLCVLRTQRARGTSR